jgi:hypothetical protein
MGIISTLGSRAIRSICPKVGLHSVRITDLLCLFAEEVKTVDMHQKTEALHFGLLTPNGGPLNFCKKLRNNKVISLIPRRNQTTRVINIDGLAKAIQKQQNGSGIAFTSAQSVLNMIEGVD